ncbi:MAG: hypothetical protein K0R05_2797 [Anaerocolumna sp.]|jgi:hypothetical protein|nr:hypothetical protein [Clostridia bacterium]MDF2871222.1 hypothetical protein [Anaerocolumna sp.]
MYKVIFIEEDEMTRNIKLENTETGTIDECFDDSALVGDNCFDFMEIGKEYNCKIRLFGNIVKETANKVVLCQLVCRNTSVGTANMVKVLVNNDEYYIPQKKLSELGDLELFYFRYSRKDLIQVNDVIHADLL